MNLDEDLAGYQSELSRKDELLRIAREALKDARLWIGADMIAEAITPCTANARYRIIDVALAQLNTVEGKE